MRESDLNGHLENPLLDAARSQKAAAGDPAAEDGLQRQQPPIEKGSKDDYQLAQAMNYLKGQPIVPATKDTKQQLTARHEKAAP